MRSMVYLSPSRRIMIQGDNFCPPKGARLRIVTEDNVNTR